MRVTEEEARRKECPVISNSDDVSFCSGSDCMAWVWDDTPAQDFEGNDLRREGHCGLVRHEP